VTIRFLQTVESSAPGYPFMPGQVISGLSRLTPEQRQWIRDGRAELVGEEPELATVGPVARAVSRKRARA
jgi:hypothetical protein